MKTFLKIFSGLIVIVIIAVAGFVYSFDANSYKSEIADVAESITGRPLSIAGNVDISVYPWIGVTINDVTIENLPGFSKKNFCTIGQFDIRMKIFPLLLKRLDIEKIVLHRLKVDFEKNAAGENNWSNFAGTSNSDNAEFGIAGLSIGGIELENANLTWLEVKTGKRFKISTMNLGTEAVVSGQPLPVSLNAYVESNQPEWQASLNVKTNIEFNSDSVIFNANNLKLVAKALLPSSKLGKVSFAMIADSEVNLQTQTAELNNVRLSILGLVMNGKFDIENIFSVPVIRGPLKINTFEAQTLAKQFKIDLPLMVNAQSLKKISLTTTFKTNFDSIYLDDISAKVDASSVSGFLHIVGMNKPVVRYDLNVDKVNLHDYRSIGGESSQSETLLPLDLIRVIDLDGKFDIETIKIDDIELTKFHVTTQVKKGIVKASPITMLVGNSHVKATMQLDTRTKPKAVFAAKIKNVDAKDSINPLLETIIGDESLMLAGIVNADVSLKTNGAGILAMKKAARGTIKISMEKTIVQGIDPEHVSRFVTAEYANKHNFRTSQSFVPEYKPDRKMEFKSLHAIFKASGGKLVNSDLSLVSDQVNITGSGSIDFIKGKLDYRPVIDMHVSNRVDIRDKLRDHPIEYHTHGVFEDLTYEFNIEKYELLVGRLLVQEGKARRNKRKKNKKNKSKNAWENVLSK